MSNTTKLDDWVVAPNIHDHPVVYELENEALRRDGRLDTALWELAPWRNAQLADIGCGTGFWLPEYAREAKHVFGVEPDPALRGQADERVRQLERASVARGSAESLPLEDDSIDIAHARFAYFFGPGAEAGLAEVRRVLRPGGVFIAIDNSWSGGEFAELLRRSTVGNGAMDSTITQRWWADQGAERVEVDGGWSCKTPDELEQVLRIEFPGEVVDAFLASRHRSAAITYRFALYVTHNL